MDMAKQSTYLHFMCRKQGLPNYQRQLQQRPPDPTGRVCPTQYWYTTGGHAIFK